MHLLKLIKVKRLHPCRGGRLLGGVFGGCSTPQPWGSVPEEGLVIAARLQGGGPYLIPPALGLSPDMLVLQISRTLGSGGGWRVGGGSNAPCPGAGMHRGGQVPPLGVGGHRCGVPPWLGSPPPRCVGAGSTKQPPPPGGWRMRVSSHGWCQNQLGTACRVRPHPIFSLRKRKCKMPSFRPR